MQKYIKFILLGVFVVLFILVLIALKFKGTGTGTSEETKVKFTKYVTEETAIKDVSKEYIKLVNFKKDAKIYFTSCNQQDKERIVIKGYLGIEAEMYSYKTNFVAYYVLSEKKWLLSSVEFDDQNTAIKGKPETQQGFPNTYFESAYDVGQIDFNGVFDKYLLKESFKYEIVGTSKLSESGDRIEYEFKIAYTTDSLKGTLRYAALFEFSSELDNWDIIQMRQLSNDYMLLSDSYTDTVANSVVTSTAFLNMLKSNPSGFANSSKPLDLISAMSSIKQCTVLFSKNIEGKDFKVRVRIPAGEGLYIGEVLADVVIRVNKDKDYSLLSIDSITAENIKLRDGLFKSSYSGILFLYEGSDTQAAPFTQSELTLEILEYFPEQELIKGIISFKSGTTIGSYNVFIKPSLTEMSKVDIFSSDWVTKPTGGVKLDYKNVALNIESGKATSLTVLYYDGTYTLDTILK